MRCNIGDGRSVSFWFDWWTDLGPLISVFGNRSTRDLRIPLDASVCVAAPNGHWTMPPARSDEAETLQVVLSTMQPPSLVRGQDRFLWRSGACSFLPKFFSKATWNIIRQPSPLVSWNNLVWFIEGILRYSFVSWMAVLSRLPTRDRLISWGLLVPPVYPLCSLDSETHDHLFFSCTFSTAIWSHFAGWMFPTPPPTLASVVDVMNLPRITSCSGAGTIIKLLLQAIVYNIWRERNHRIFRDSSSTVAAIAKAVDRSMRDRLLSLPSPSPDGTVSLLQLYFSIPRLFPP